MKQTTTSLLISGILTTVMLSQITMPVSAATLGATNLGQEVSQMQNQASKAANRQLTALQTLIQKADTMITNRTATLTTLSTRVGEDTRLSSGEKASLTSEIQATSTGLADLQTKIDADTDLTTARADAKSIVTNFYVYAAFEPKIRLIIIMNNLQSTSATIAALVPRMQTLITTLQSQGKDVSGLQALLADVSAQLQKINTTLSADLVTVQAVSTTSGTQSATFTKVRQDISQVVRAGVMKIRADFAKMRPLFRSEQSAKPTAATTSATPK